MNNDHIGLTKETASIFETISKMECLKSLTLCGGTAISLQCGHRLSEDLDFELIATKKIEEGLDFSGIINETTALFPGTKREILGDDHFLLFLPNNVKLSFFKPQNRVPTLNLGYEYNNIKAPNLQEMLGMKVFNTSVRSSFRDYYDIFCLVEEGYDINKAIQYAYDFSRHTTHSKQFIENLIVPGLYTKEKDFDVQFNTKYNISAREISDYLKDFIAFKSNKSKSLHP